MGAYDVQLSATGRAAWTKLGLTMPPDTAPAHQRQQMLFRGIHRLTEQFGGREAAVAALVVELHRVTYAVDQARASGAEDPTVYAGFRSFLPPDDRDAADPVIRETFALTTAFGMAWPVDESARISSPFGWRKHPVLGQRKRHTGVDIAVRTGTPIQAVADGRVVYAGKDAVNGNFVKLDHGHGLTTAYCHASSLLVTRGATVKMGNQIARSGKSGRVSGPHLHFQLEIDGVPVDPELFRSGGTSGEAPDLLPKPAPRAPPRKAKGSSVRTSSSARSSP